MRATATVLSILSAVAALAGGTVDVLTLADTINPASAAYLVRGIEAAEGDGAECVVILLDTPGGSVSSMRKAVQKMLDATVPVVVYVYPPGAQAASAGTFIAMASHVAAMAPATSVGAAHPVVAGGEGGGEQVKILLKKEAQDLSAFIKSLATKRRRNAEWAVLAVNEAASASAEDAVEKRVVEFIANDMGDLLERLDGREVSLPAGQRTLDTKDAVLRYVPMTAVEKFLSVVANPNLAYILLMLGIYALIFEFKSGSMGIAAVVGAICLILALYALSALEVSYAGLALILLAIGLFIAELYTPTHGALTIGGIVALTLGSFMLTQSNEPGLRIAPAVIISGVATTTAFFVFCIGAIIRGQKRKIVTGKEGIIGTIAVAKSELNMEGSVFAEGTLWTATATEGPISRGARVRVVDVDGLKLIVRPVTDDDSTSGAR
ncbi:MAG: nodulation protein NfeD [Armatimonadota bacterium]